MFKRLRYTSIAVLFLGTAAVAYVYLSKPSYQRKIVQTFEEMVERVRGSKPPKWTGTVVVVEAVDGDKLLVNTEETQRVKVSLAGIDAPELGIGDRKGQPLAEQSRAYLAQLTTNRAATMMIVGTDSSKRPQVLLEVEGSLINAEMAEAGLAEVTAEGLGSMATRMRHRIQNAEYAAREKHLGIWGLTNYVRPVEYRIRLR